jgi:mxaL protein
MPIGTEHLTSVREPYLRELASGAGLAYAHLDRLDGLASALRAVARPRVARAPLDLRPAFASGAVAGFAALFLVIPLVVRARARRPLPATPPRRKR